jgi:thioredoxin-like negative regulator of GroEL
MQVSHSSSLPALTVSLEQQRNAATQLVQTLPLASQVGRSEATLRSVESIKQAEQLLQHEQSQQRLTQQADNPRNQRAVMRYQSVQAGQERDYVSEVLGIDIYA